MNDSNLKTQHVIKAEVLKSGLAFSASGLHFLACRRNGSQYKALMNTIYPMLLDGTLKSSIPADLLDRIEQQFGERVKNSPEALLILGMGRKPIWNSNGWHEESETLFKLKALAPEFPGMTDTQIKRIQTAHDLRVRQSALATELSQHWLALRKNEIGLDKKPEISMDEPVKPEKDVKPKTKPVTSKKSKTKPVKPKISLDKKSKIETVADVKPKISLDKKPKVETV